MKVSFFSVIGRLEHLNKEHHVRHIHCISILILILAAFSASAQSINYGGWDFDPPAPFQLRYANNEEVYSATGNCLITTRARQARTQWLELSQVERDGTVNEEQIVHLDPQGFYMVQSNTGALSACDGKNKITVEPSLNGGKKLIVTCGGSFLRGSGQGRLEMTADSSGRLTAVKLDNKHGWYQGNYRGILDCTF